MTNLQLDRPALASVPANKPGGRPKKVRIDAVDKQARKKVARVKSKEKEKEGQGAVIDPLLRDL